MSEHRDEIYQQYQRAHEALHELSQRQPLASDQTERARAIREAMAAERRVIALTSEALGWFRGAA